MLISQALKQKNVTYINITPAPHTLPMLAAQGYQRFCNGRFVAVPTLSALPFGARVRAFTASAQPGSDLRTAELELLRAHADLGCLSLICNSADGRHPFIFAQRIGRMGRYAQLIYCRDLDDFVRFAGALGLYLARRRLLLVAIDASDSIPGLVGIYHNNKAKYFKGPNRPRPGDLTFTELVLFGI